MPKYPVRLIPGEDGLVLVTFPDVPEAVSCGAGEEDAIEKAQGKPLPAPSDICGAPTVAPKRTVRW